MPRSLDPETVPAPGAAPRQTRRYAQKRDAILHAAAALINEAGVKGTTLADVARSVGLMTNSVTYYYRRKEDLAAACFLHTIGVLDGLVARAEGAPDGPARLARLLDLVVAHRAAMAAGEEPDIAVLNDVRALPAPQAESVFSAYNALFRRLRGWFDEDGLDRADRNARTHLLLSVMHSTRLWIHRYEPRDYAKAGARMADLLTRGMAAPGSGWRPGLLPETAPPEESEVSPEAFLRAATILINQQGYRGASVEKISGLLKVTKGSFYHHNDNKDDLVANCFSRSFAQIRAVQDAADAGGGSGWDRICTASATLVRSQLGPGGPLLRVTAFSALPEALRTETRRTMNRLTERFGLCLVDGMVDGSVRPLDAGIAAQLVSSMVNAAAELPAWVPGVTPDNAAELYARPLFLGLFAPAAR
ncbi:TetR/AcrR family transcriptional regulator [Methylobacterium platani]|uniref:TetR family transcriptional regulator n=2 Tax=Methylobacterium platani TaxID=427683 RepID=A0A179SFW1_9HYPH|nr:TetR/AcrR family transcriptional regulator [Methylobacterium platani]KMO21664.1 TetR family transcriptional regulator [Methylobacterium platani JCM 14648]OAS25844.1 TetR family transcriptional regulator [Methylobacterium platani]